MRSGGRVVEGARLESEYTAKPYRGFESLPLRHLLRQNAVLQPESSCVRNETNILANKQKLVDGPCWLHQRLTTNTSLLRSPCTGEHVKRATKDRSIVPLPVSYMGTKRQLATVVSDMVELSPPGPLLDVFAGMCAVATAVGPRRQVWTNDLQHFAHNVARAHFCAQADPPTRLDAAAITMSHYSQHIVQQGKNCSARIRAEHRALEEGDYEQLGRLYSEWESTLDVSSSQLAVDRPANLFAETFAGSYFGLSQCIEIDAIRSGIDLALASGHVGDDQHRWLILALCVAISKVSTSTGHFAQPLTPKRNNIRRFTKQRSLSVRESWLSAVEHLSPVGNRQWRQQNKAFIGDAMLTLQHINTITSRPAVVYADPPYTNDQYSRYYHVYETLILYDFPTALGKGRYRPDRAVSDFSLATRVERSINDLISQCSVMGCDLVLSYPADGLLRNSRAIIPSLIRQHYGREPTVIELEHVHSTMGGSKGSVKQDVIEVLYRAFH